jgi:cytoskeletal protein RodZ
MEENTQKSIGAYLKSMREQQEKSIKEISQKTCISEQYLRNIESDKFDDMGGLGYAKAITMTYVKALNANEKIVMQLFDSRYSSPVKEALYRREQQPRKFMISTNIISVFLLMILITVLVLVILKLYRNGELNFPFRHNAEETRTEKVSLIKDSVISSLSTYTAEAEDKIEENKSDKKFIEQPKAVQIDISAFRDSTDYADKYLFKGKESPYNVKE